MEPRDTFQTGLRTRFTYDPVVKGYDTNFWKTLSGTPSVASNNIRLNSARMASYSQYVYGDFHFEANVATTPSAGEAKIIGLRNPACPTVGAAYFEITGATFRAVTYDVEKNTTATNITWNSKGETWNGNMTKFRIVWTANYVKFYVGGADAPYATHEGSDNIPNVALAIDINNGDSDNLDIDWIKFDRIGTYIS